jgi:carboxymethylenebutenolidase
MTIDEQGEIITFRLGRGTRPAYVVRPEGDGPFPGVIVIHELSGLNDNIKDICRQFADTGFAALGVDLFAGHNRNVCMTRLFSGMVLNSYHNSGIKELRAALTCLGERPKVDAERIGAIGFCMGGGFAVAWGAKDKRLKAIAPYYAINPRPLAAVARSCPVVGSYPEQDYTAKHGQKLERVLASVGVPHDIKIYPGAGHSFFNDEGGSYDAEAAHDSWARVQAFFDRHVKGTAGAS